MTIQRQITGRFKFCTLIDYCR